MHILYSEKCRTVPGQYNLKLFVVSLCDSNYAKDNGDTPDERRAVLESTG
jgi:hypothetical protein